MSHTTYFKNKLFALILVSKKGGIGLWKFVGWRITQYCVEKNMSLSKDLEGSSKYSKVSKNCYAVESSSFYYFYLLCNVSWDSYFYLFIYFYLSIMSIILFYICWKDFHSFSYVQSKKNSKRNNICDEFLCCKVERLNPCFIFLYYMREIDCWNIFFFLIYF